MLISPFQPIGLAFIITTNATPSTSQSTLVSPGTLGLSPPFGGNQIRCLNKGASDVWVLFSNASTAAVIPVAGTTTTGTPNCNCWLEQNVDLVFTLPCIIPSAGFYINTISVGTSQNVYFQLGEGS